MCQTSTWSLITSDFHGAHMDIITLRFNATEADALDQVALCDEKQHDERRRTHHTGSENPGPVRTGLRLEKAQPDR
jgi:hypothetical protein